MKLKSRMTRVLVYLTIFAFMFTLPLSGGVALANNTIYNTVDIKFLLPGTKYETPVYIIKSNVPGPTVLYSGGVHGNETAGYEAAHLLQTYKIAQGTLIVIPQTNVQAVDASRRYIAADGDLNRAFPSKSETGAGHPLVEPLLQLVKDYDVQWHFDLHEGIDYATSIASDSVGQSIIYHPNRNGYTIGNAALKFINNTIPESYRKFKLLKWPVKGSFARSTGDLYGINTFIIETMQKENLTERIRLQTNLADWFLNRLSMLPSAGQTVISTTPTPTPAATNKLTFQTETLAAGTAQETSMYVVKSSNPGPTVMLVGGVHGNEQASAESANKYTKFPIPRGTLIVIPEADKVALNAGVSSVNGYNLDRQFPSTSTESADGPLAQDIWSAVQRYGVTHLVSMQENVNFYKDTATTSYGNTVTFYPLTNGKKLATKIADTLNADITGTYYQFATIKWPGKTSLTRAAGDLLGVKSLIFRTTTKDTWANRVNYQDKMVNTALSDLYMVQGARDPAPYTVNSVTLADGTADATPMYVIKSYQPGPVTMLVGGTHGNAPAGVEAAKLFTDYPISQGTLLVIPEASKLAVAAGTSYSNGINLDRQFPTDPTGTSVGPLAQGIWSAVKDYGVTHLVSLQENSDYYNNPKTSSYGNSMIYYPTTDMQTLSKNLLTALNSSITNPYNQFVALKFPPKSTLARSAGELLGINAFIFRTTVSENLDSRVATQKSMIEAMLTELNMK